MKGQNIGSSTKKIYKQTFDSEELDSKKLTYRHAFFTSLLIFALRKVSFLVLGLENLLFRGQKLEGNYYSEGKNQKKSKKEA